MEPTPVVPQLGRAPNITEGCFAFPLQKCVQPIFKIVGTVYPIVKQDFNELSENTQMVEETFLPEFQVIGVLHNGLKLGAGIAHCYE